MKIDNSEFQMYDGRKVKPLLMKIAKEKNKTYQEVKEKFIELFAKDSRKKFQKVCEKVFA